jgi:hypothetical protein
MPRERLVLKTFADRLCLYHDQELIATHPRSYERHRDFEHPDHPKELLHHAETVVIEGASYRMKDRVEA